MNHFPDRFSLWVPSLKSSRRSPFGGGQQGSSAIEVLLLIVMIVIPIWMLLVNMSYNGVRHRKAQGALRMGAFQYVSGLTTKKEDQAKKDAEAAANSAFFPGETKAAQLTFNGKALAPGVGDPPPDPGTPSDPETDVNTQSILGSVSSRVNVGVSASRVPPYRVSFFKGKQPPIQRGLIVAANTWTYCEMKDQGFGNAMGVLNGLALVGDYGLWLFGGCGGSTYDFSCDDRCQK